MSKSGEEWEEYNKACSWMLNSLLISLALTIILALIAIPLGYLLGNGISKDTLNDVGKFMQIIMDNHG